MRLDPLLGALRHALRRWRVDRLAIGVVLVAVTFTALLAAAVPRLATRTADEALRVEAAHADEAARSLQISRTRSAPGGDGFLEAEAEAAAMLIERAPAEVRALAGEPTITLDARRFIIGADAGRPAAGAFLTVRGQPGIDAALALDAGRLPVGARYGKVTDDQRRLTVEVAISRAAADSLGMALGDRFSVTPDPNAGPLAADRGVSVTLEIVGVFDAVDATSGYWAGRSQLLSASTFDMGESQTIFATAAAGSDGLAALAAIGLQMTTAVTYPLRVDDLTASAAPRLARAFEELPVAYRGLRSGPLDTVTVRSGFGIVIERFIETEAATARLMSVALASLAGVALMTIVLLALMLAARRREAVRLDRQRGASAVQVIAPAVVEALLVGAAAAIIGFLVARGLLPGGDDGPSFAAGAMAGGAAALALIAAAGASFEELRRHRAGQEPVAQGPTRRRLVGELVVLLLAALGVYLLRSRGLSANAANAASGIDPFLAAVPLLAALGMALVVLRAYPLPLLALAAVAGRGRGLTAAFGLRRAGAGQSQRLPIVALLLATALGVFGISLAVSIGAGQAAAALERVGADYRIEGVTGPNPSRLGVENVPGVSATAAAWSAPDSPIITATRRGGATARLIGVQVDGIEAVTGEPLPAELRSPYEPDTPLPALISTRLGPAAPITPGDTFWIVVGSERIEMLAVAARPGWPAMTVGEQFVVVSLPVLGERLERTLAPTQLLAGGDPGLGDAIRQRALDAGAVSVVIARDETLADIRESPFSIAVVGGYALSMAIAAGYVVMAVIIGLLLGGQARDRDLAHLRTMGLSGRETLGLVALEQIPMPLIGVAAGGALGLVLVALVGPGLDLGAFTGTTQPIRLAVPWPLLAALGGAFAGVMMVVTLLAAFAAGRVDPARALRLGDA